MREKNMLAGLFAGYLHRRWWEERFRIMHTFDEEDDDGDEDKVRACTAHFPRSNFMKIHAVMIFHRLT